MNQQIQFPEREWWDEASVSVCFPAMVGGLQVICAIGADVLHQRFGTDESALNLFRLYRWDIEDEAEQLIQSCSEDERGWFLLT
ncbi:MAG: hypothetical protein XXXJIFNMEKO3_02907 [Candidatus Erwinia impunctatus]|nr:hypothetical protein XXXJIFNMEKO_02907 [Culicoides impunctatus]